MKKIKQLRNKKKVAVVGAGPAGLACAYELIGKNDANLSVVLFDKNTQVGGLARTYKFKNFYFDVGPHRFYTKNKEVLTLWKKILKKEFIKIHRLTRILYNNKFFMYPIQPIDIISKLGIKDLAHSFISFIYARTFLVGKKVVSFEDWIVKNFGKKLYSIFFKTYTEKVWGIACKKISAEWAAQRIKNLNFTEVVKTAFFGQRARKAKSLIDWFYYPTKGAGYLYQKMARKIKQKSGVIKLNSLVGSINHSRGKVLSIEYTELDKKQKFETDFLFSSMPLTHFVLALNPRPRHAIVDAAKKLYYRDHITVNLLIKGSSLFPDNWIYVHSRELKMSRLTNYNNFYVKTKKKLKNTALSVEYFAFQGDDIWKKTDEQLIILAENELARTGLVKPGMVIDGFVVRETESYPVYYVGHKKYFDTLKEYSDSFENLQLIGRGGMYKYNNMDHSIYTGMLAARNFFAQKKKHDIWQVNEDAQNHEEK